MDIRILLLIALNPDQPLDGNLPIYDYHLILSDCAKISKNLRQKNHRDWRCGFFVFATATKYTPGRLLSDSPACIVFYGKYCVGDWERDKINGRRVRIHC